MSRYVVVEVSRWTGQPRWAAGSVYDELDEAIDHINVIETPDSIPQYRDMRVFELGGEVWAQRDHGVVIHHQCPYCREHIPLSEQHHPGVDGACVDVSTLR